MKKITKRLIALLLALCMTAGFTTLCFAEDDEATKLSKLSYELILPGEKENWHTLLFFYLPEGYLPGSPEAQFTFNSPRGLHTGTMSEFDIRMIENEGKQEVLYTICLPSNYLVTRIVFNEGAFVHPNGTSAPAFATEKCQPHYSIPFNPYNAAEGKNYEGKPFYFYLSTTKPLLADMISVKCTDSSGQSISCEIGTSYSEQSLTTYVTLPLEVGMRTYELYYNNTLLVSHTVYALTVEDYMKECQKDHTRSVLSGIGVIPLVPIYILAGALQYTVIAPVMLFIPFLWSFLPLLPVAPVAGFGFGMYSGVRGWIEDMQYFFSGKESHSNTPVPSIRNNFLI